MVTLELVNEERPWGGFRKFVENKSATVKILFVNKGEASSLQKHNHRSEFWRVLIGDPSVTIGDKTIKAKPGDEFSIPAHSPHRIEAENEDVQVLEISTGEFSEEDIVRIEDKYGRT